VPVESIDDKLRFAIANRRLLELSYHGRLRVVEPHDYGIQRGTTRLLVYQLRGSGGRPQKSDRGWRLLDVPKISTCTVLDETFPGSRGQSHQQHFVWDVVYARVA
jgi:hypothetical protein